jgi:protein-disulfide isomerase
MRFLTFLFALSLLLSSNLSFADDAAVTPKPLTDAERAAIEGVIKDYLTNKHPEVMVEGMQELQKRDQAGAETKSKQAVQESHDKIFNDPATPVGGNPKGDVTIVEFYDFQCGYCKMSEEATEKLLKTDKNVKFVYKDFPILGPMSTQASKAALASIRQDKFVAFHDALMNRKEHLSDDIIYQTAKQVGIDVDRLKKDMGDDAIAKQIEANLKLGSDIGVRGTPMFIVGEQVYPGALQYDQIKKAVDDVRTGSKKP